MTAEKPEVAVSGGEEAVDAHVSLGDHGMKNAAHPSGGGERRLIWGEASTRAEDMALRTEHFELFAFEVHYSLLFSSHLCC